MDSLQWLLDLVLVFLLAATLFHAVRLERALGVLRRDRAAMDELMENFKGSTREVETGIERLRLIADGAGQQVSRQSELGISLKDDLGFLIDRGNGVADRLDALIRTARPIAAAEAARPAPDRYFAVPREPAKEAAEPVPRDPPEPARMRSQAERDLMLALRMAK